MKRLCATTLAAATLSGAAFAQTVSSPTPPIPSQLASAHNIFLGCGGAPAVGGHDAEAAAMLYTSAYKALTSAGRYHLAATPADADLSMTISIQPGYSDVTHGSSIETAYIRLSISDIKTHTLLWNINEPVSGAFRKTSFQKNIDESVAKVLGDLNVLATGKLP